VYSGRPDAEEEAVQDGKGDGEGAVPDDIGQERRNTEWDKTRRGMEFNVHRRRVIRVVLARYSPNSENVSLKPYSFWFGEGLFSKLQVPTWTCLLRLRLT
jgi:hypothetical protein